MLVTCPQCGDQSDVNTSRGVCRCGAILESRNSDVSQPVEVAKPDILQCPGTVVAAGWIWTIFGILMNLLTCGGMVAEIVMQAQRPGQIRPQSGSICVNVLGIALGAGFFAAGVQLVRRKAKDTIVVSILSILIGLLYLGIGSIAILLPIGNKANPGLEAILAIVGIVCAVIGCALILPGVLALMGRSEYRDWWSATHPTKRRRRRRVQTDEEQERVDHETHDSNE